MASLLAQGFRDWECILVDDGSTDGTFDWMRSVSDSRFRSFRSEVNRGRGAARQFALENSRGRWLCMLDADDWYYPQKLERQVAFMESNPGRLVAGAGIAIVDRKNRLAGVRRAPSCSVWTPGGDVNVTFAPTIIRLDAARKVGFAHHRRVAEDRDFMAAILREGGYGCVPEILYGYTEYESATLDKVLGSHRATRDRQRCGPPAHGFIARKRESVGFHLKTLLYRAVFATGQQNRMVRRRSVSATPEEAESFALAWRQVEAVLGQIDTNKN